MAQFDDSAYENATPSFDDSVFERVAQPQQSQTEATLRGAVQGATLGTAPYFGALTGGLPGTNGYNEALTQQKNDYSAAANQYPLSNLGGNIVGSLPTLAAGELGLAKIAPGLGPVARGATIGGTSGAVQGAAGSSNLDEAAMNSAIGLGLGVVGGGAGSWLGGYAGSILPNKAGVLNSTAQQAQSLFNDAQLQSINAAERTVKGRGVAITPVNQWTVDQADAVDQALPGRVKKLVPGNMDVSEGKYTASDIQKHLVDQQVANPQWNNTPARQGVETVLGAAAGHYLGQYTGGGELGTVLGMMGGAKAVGSGALGMTTTPLAGMEARGAQRALGDTGELVYGTPANAQLPAMVLTNQAVQQVPQTQVGDRLKSLLDNFNQ